MESPDEYNPGAYLEKLDRFFAGEEQTTLYFDLEKAGNAPPLNPEELSDEEVSLALTNLVWGIWDLGVVIEYTDHLSDRELFVELLEYCDRPTVVFPETDDVWRHWSPIGSFSTEEDNQLYLRYYADEESRQRDAADAPTLILPPAELPRYFRSWLPQRRDVMED